MKITKNISLVSAIMLCIIFTTSAQDKKATIGIGIGGASVSSKDSDSGKSSGFGFNFYLNGMYNINENISAGIEYNANLAVVTEIDLTSAEVSVTKINGILAKGRYKIGTGENKLFVGLMAGIYLIKPGEVTVTGTNFGFVFDSKSTFGFAPEVGVEIGSFQLATSLHLPGKYTTVLTNPIDGSTTSIETNFTIWQFNLGWNIGLAFN